MAERRDKPDWKKSVSKILSPVVSVRTPTGRIEERVSPWRVAAIVALLAALVGGVVYWRVSHDTPGPAQNDPLF
jgi:hypothetical protein